MKKISLMIALSLFVVSGCSTEQSSTNEQLNKNGDTSSNEKQKEQENIESTERDASDTIDLAFEPVETNQNVKEATNKKGGPFLKEKSISTGKVVTLTNKENEKYLNGGFLYQGRFYDLGVIGSSTYDDAKIEELSLFDKKIVKITASMGANSAMYNYFLIKDGSIKPFLKVDNGHAKEVDLDGDGTPEIVSTSGTPWKTYIYRWDGSEFEMTDLNNATGALSVMLTDNKNFRANYKDSGKMVEYRYKSGKLERIK